ncbi:ABC transporter substrate-binding protein [Hathewaya histolytica]|uniref:ABC transporter substrate-binding protein n=1 Tax=Hathewaya histolytica TaxID=1498 RepID=UPI003B682737
MKKFNRLCSAILVIILSLTLVCCKGEEKKEKKNGSKNLDIYVYTDDKYSKKAIDVLIREYENKNKDKKINVIDGVEDKDKLLKYFKSGDNIDIIVCNRSTELLLDKKGLVDNLEDIYKNESLDKRFYEVYTSYGRILNKYSSVGIIPYTLEFVYNKDALNKLGLKEPQDFKDYIKILKQCISNHIEVPYVLNEDLSIYEVIFSLFAQNKLNGEELTEKYTDKSEEYLNDDKIEKVLKLVEKNVKEQGLKEDILKKSDEKDIEYFLKGESPILITTSYFSNKLKGENIGILKNMGRIDGEEIIRPVFMNALVVSNINGINKESKKDFQEFVVSNEFQNKLKELSYITGNKEANKSYKGLQGSVVENLLKSSSNSIIYKDNLPEDIQKSIESSIRDILKGKYKDNYLKEKLKNK